MQKDLQGLDITPQEIAVHAGLVTYQSVIRQPTLLTRLLIITCTLPVVLSLLIIGCAAWWLPLAALASPDASVLAHPMLGIVVPIMTSAGVTLLVLMHWFTQALDGQRMRKLLLQWQRQKRTGMAVLTKEIAHYNQMLKDMQILDQLQAVGNPIYIDNRDAVLASLRTTRDMLICALKTARILQENPSFHPEHFHIELLPAQALEVRGRANDYGLRLNEALQIGVSVQEQMCQFLAETRRT